MAYAVKLLMAQLWAPAAICLGMLCWTAVVGFPPESAQQIHDWASISGALNRDVMTHQPWRVATAIFAHSGINHLVTNCLAVFILSTLCLPLLGPYRVVWVSWSMAWVGGICASIMEPGWVLGASGAYYGLCAFAAGSIFKERGAGSFSQGTALLGTLMAMQSIFGGDGWAHSGAAIIGLGFGYLSRPKPLSWSKKAAATVLALGTVSCITHLFTITVSQ